MQIDHVVLWVGDPKRALEFYVDVLGLPAVRARDFEEGTALFPSVRLNDTTILDLMDRAVVPLVQGLTRSESGGAPINHVCFSMSASEYASLTGRLAERGIGLVPGGEASFGAQGVAAQSAYLRDPDGNVLEIRHYETET